MQLNDRITLKNSIAGVVRYIGPVEGRAEEWVGIELDEPRGSNNGCINNRRYFFCSEKHGLFVKYERLAQKMSAVDRAHDNYTCESALSSLELSHSGKSREGKGFYSSGAGGGQLGHAGAPEPCTGSSLLARPTQFADFSGEHSLFVEPGSSQAVQERPVLREQNEQYKHILSLILDKSSASLGSIQASLEDVQNRICKLKTRRRTATERDRVVQLVSQIYQAERDGGSATDAYEEFKAIMGRHGIDVDSR